MQFGIERPNFTTFEEDLKILEFSTQSGKLNLFCHDVSVFTHLNYSGDRDTKTSCNENATYSVILFTFFRTGTVMMKHRLEIIQQYVPYHLEKLEILK